MARKAISGIEAARAWMEEDGLDLPPVPDSLAPSFRKRGWDKAFASSPFQASPYRWLPYLEREAGTPKRDYVLLALDGHGINSWALHYFLVLGPLRVFLQLPWGGAYNDARADRRVIRGAFRAVQGLLDAIQSRPVLKAPLVVAGSGLDASGAWSIGKERHAAAGPREALEGATAWLAKEPL